MPSYKYNSCHNLNTLKRKHFLTANLVLFFSNTDLHRELWINSCHCSFWYKRALNNAEGDWPCGYNSCYWATTISMLIRNESFEIKAWSMNRIKWQSRYDTIETRVQNGWTSIMMEYNGESICFFICMTSHIFKASFNKLDLFLNSTFATKLQSKTGCWLMSKCRSKTQTNNNCNNIIIIIIMIMKMTNYSQKGSGEKLDNH